MRDNSCRKDPVTILTNCHFYYIKKNGITKCAELMDCTFIHYLYLRGNECKKECEDIYYKFNATSLGLPGFTKCYATTDECLTAITPRAPIYYNTKYMLCWDHYVEGYFINKVEPTKYELVEECNDYYYENVGDGRDGNNYCVSACNAVTDYITDLYFLRGTKKCAKTCKEFNLYYYHPDTHECLETCKDLLEYRYQMKPLGFPDIPLPCLDKCPDGYDGTPYYSYDSNVCLKRCGEDGSNNKYHIYNKYVCYPSCLDIPTGKYIYQYLEDSTYDVYSCYDEDNKPSAPSGDCPFYYLLDDGTKKCQKLYECKDRNYIYLHEEECRDRCDEYYKLEVDMEYLPYQSNTFIRCFDKLDDFFNDPTYTHNNPGYYFENTKQCWTKFPSGYFIKNYAASLPIKNELIEKCENYYYIDDSGRKICVDDCKTQVGLYFFKGNQKCETDCLKFLKNYYDPENHECLDTCKGREVNKFQNRVPDNPSNALPCLNKCNSPSYYDSDSNICLSFCGNGDPKKRFHTNKGDDDDYICYASCVLIPGGQYIYEYNDRYDFSCYDDPEQITGCTYYYTKLDGTKKCTTLANCINILDYKYFLDKECKKDCDGYYKLEVTDGYLHYTKCFASIGDVLQAGSGIMAYDITNKLCWAHIPDDYFVNSVQTGPKYEVVRECAFYYKKVGGTPSYNKCVTSCYNEGLFYIKGQKNCEESCTKFHKHYSSPIDNQCLDSCKGLVSYPFANKVDTANPVQVCREICDNTDTSHNKYYDYNSNLCIEKCGDDNIYNLYHAVEKYICYPSCKDISNVYKYESLDQSDNTKICYESLPDTDCPYYYMKKNGAYKCLNNKKDCLDMKYNYLLGQECRKECDDYYKLEDIDTSLNLIKCFEKKDDCLNSEVKYYNIKLKRCWKILPYGYYIITIEANGYEVVKECQKYYFRDINIESNYHCIEKCSESGTHLHFYKEEKNCEESCKAFNKHYKDPITNECLDTCIGRQSGTTYIEFANEVDYTSDEVSDCKEKCDDNYYYNYGTKICIYGTCSSANKYNKEGEAEHVCYNSCDEIPDVSKIYEADNTCYEERLITSTLCPLYYKKGYKTLKCVTSATDCINAGYNYLYGKECKKNCDNYYKLIDGNNIIKCYDNYEKAFEENHSFIYYDITLKQCWKTFPTGYFVKYDNNGENYEIVSECEKYYYLNNNGFNYCIDNCIDVIDIDLYFIQQNKKCEKSCSKPDINKFYFDKDNHECLDTCVGKDNLEYALPLDIDNPTRPCISKCPKRHFITKEDSNGLTHYECVDECPFDSNYKHLDNKTKECLTCSEDKYIVKNNICYPKCDVANDYLYIDTDTYVCLKACPSYLKKQELLTTLNGKNVYLCKSHCEEKFLFRLGDECLEKCPEDHNYIGYNNICKKKCALDDNGEHYYPINEDESNPPEYLIYNCTDSCDNAIVGENENQKTYLFYTELEPNKCLKQCPETIHFYLESNEHKCISKCPYNFPFYKGDENNYQCNNVTHCTDPNKYFSEGYCVTLDECPESPNNKKYVDSRNICMDKCPDNEIKSKLKSYDNAYKCLRNCPGTFIFQKNVEDEPECRDYCPKEKNFIGLDNICKQSCEEEDGLYYYKYTEEVTDSDSDEKYTVYKCINDCETYNDGEYKLKEVNNGKECYRSCTQNYPYLSIEENLCYDDCHKSDKNTFTVPFRSPINNICDDKCDENTIYKYWGENKNCTDACSSLGDTSIIDHDNKCVEKCDLNSTYKFELDGRCYNTCYQPNVSTSKLRYSLGDYKCKPKCGEDEYIINGNQCNETCNNFINEIDTGEKECISACYGVKIYYYESEKVCLSRCKNDDKIVEGLNICVDACNKITNKKYYLYESEVTGDTFDYDMCVERCPTQKPYINGDECVKICPEENRYFVNPDKICLNDCPKEYPYYTIMTDYGKKYYTCQADCPGFFIEDVNSLINAKLCLESCPDNNYPDYIEYKYELEYEKDGNTIRQCYKDCPDEYRYHLQLSDTVTDNNCYAECPLDKKVPYHKRGENICLKQSELHGGFLLYDIKEWTNSIVKCPDEYTLYSKTDDDNNVGICLNSCNFKYYDEGNNRYYEYKYLTQYNTCVRDCSTSRLVSGKNYINDEENKKCACKNLFYIDLSTSFLICYEDTVKTCSEGSNLDYWIPLNGTKECLKTCSDNRILTPSEDVCYEVNTSCSDVYPYTNTRLITNKFGLKKCECMYKFYFDGDKKICLGENDVCPEGKKLLVPDTLECVSSCPSDVDNYYPYNFKTFCLNHCPLRAKIDTVNKRCDCGEKFWYEKSHGNYECLEENCLSIFPLYVGPTRQCVQNCTNTDYKYLYDNKCYENCDFLPHTLEKEIDSPLGIKTCFCKKFWYYDINNNNIMHCPPDDSIQKCRDYAGQDVPYLVEETGQCVKKCPTDYPYYYNDICYSSCEYANEVLDINIETVEYSYECRCKNIWNYDPNDVYGKDIICYPKNRTDCDPALDTTGNNNTYLINVTGQCVPSRNDCPPNSFKFSYACYEKCPEFTLEGKETLSDGTIDNICICDKRSYIWLEYKKYGNTHYKCGLSSCPGVFIDGGQEYIRNNYLEIENKCVKSCREDGSENNKYLHSFRGKCVQKCPTATEPTYDECVFIDVNDEEKVDNLDTLKEVANIQAKELFEQSDSASGFLMNKYDASLQIYALGKLNTNKELAMKSNLTYIDLGTCFDKIYADNNLEETDNILVTKYDLLSRIHNNEESDNDNTAKLTIDDKFLTNQVEYEFYLQKTNEKIEGSICSPFEILISYPILFNKNKNDQLEKGNHRYNYTKLFEIGKELHERDPEIDTFNKNNKVYKDLCYGLEIDGKDLVLEERYNYLYPNNISLCESNCTINNTDFDLERINCNCTYKEIFDFYRIDEDANDIINDPNFEKKGQSNTNAEIIRCLTKMELKNGIVKNEAFYYSCAVIFIEFTMVLVAGLQGIKTVASLIKELLKVDEIKSISNNDIKSRNKTISTKKYSDFESVNKLITNPPKKGSENNDNEYDLEEAKDEFDNNENNNINNKKKVKLNYISNDNTSKSDISKITINSNNNLQYFYEPMVRPGYKKIRRRNNYMNQVPTKANLNAKLNNFNYIDYKAEFIPPKYNFKFFKPYDSGIVKRIQRSEIPFKVNVDTRILLELKEDVPYPKNYLKGPFYENQNIIEIIEDNDKKNVNNIKNDKVSKFTISKNSHNSKNTYSNDSIIITKSVKSNSKKGKDDLIKEENLEKEAKAIISKEKDFIKLTRLNPITNKQITIDNTKTEESSKRGYKNISCWLLIKREHTYLRFNYDYYVSKLHPSFFATFCAEICDKIYLIKTCIFLKKFDIFSIHFALYVFYHMLLFSLICGFFTINTIKRIWEESDFPRMNFYLLYGFLANVIIWVFYKIFLLFLDNQDRIRALVELKNVKKNNNIISEKLKRRNDDIDSDSSEKEQLNPYIALRYEEFMRRLKIQISVFYIIIFLFTGFCAIYLVTFFAFYTGTKRLVIKAYYISIIEIIIIKFIYGLSIAALRIASEKNKYKRLYNFVYICDKYLA